MMRVRALYKSLSEQGSRQCLRRFLIADIVGKSATAESADLLCLGTHMQTRDIYRYNPAVPCILSRH